MAGKELYYVLVSSADAEVALVSDDKERAIALHAFMKHDQSYGFCDCKIYETPELFNKKKLVWQADKEQKKEHDPEKLREEKTWQRFVDLQGKGPEIHLLYDSNDFGGDSDNKNGICGCIGIFQNTDDALNFHWHDRQGRKCAYSNGEDCACVSVKISLDEFVGYDEYSKDHYDITDMIACHDLEDDDDDDDDDDQEDNEEDDQEDEVTESSPKARCYSKLLP
jgi:hypothetical protein